MPAAGESLEEAAAAERVADLRHTGTHSSYDYLIGGGPQLIFVAREPSEDELRLAEEKEVELDVREIARDAFVFIVNKENPTSNMTTEQIQSVYTGELTEWGDVGEFEGQIQPYQRDENSGSQELMKSLVMKDLQMVDAPDMIAHGMIGPINSLDHDQVGLGFSVYFYVKYIAPVRNLKMIAVDGVYPTSETIADGTYPYATGVYAVTLKSLDPQSNAAKLRDWLLTDAGQRCVAASGYVPLHRDAGTE
jgi:phosphate transport system substrate-binding protein